MVANKINSNAAELISDAFAKAEPWAAELCGTLRKLIHHSIPGVLEDWKWGPNFNHQGMVCGLWPFKKHVSLVFFKGAGLEDPHQLLQYGEGKNARNRMMKFFPSDEPDFKVVGEYLKAAALLNESGVVLPRLREEIPVPAYITEWLEKAGMLEQFETFSVAQKREIIEYIKEAKREETKMRRLEKVEDKIRGSKTDK